MPPEKIPPKWVGNMNEENERKLRFQAYQEACEQYKRDGYWKEKVRVSISDTIEIYKNLCKYVDSHPFDKAEKNRKAEYITCFIFVAFVLAFVLAVFSVFIYIKFFHIS